MENENIITEYLQGNLSEEQKRDFEQRLKSDQVFYQEYLWIKRTHAYLNERRNRESYTSELDQLSDKYFDSDESQSRFSLKTIALLIITALAILLAGWYFLKPQKTDLYDSHSKHFALHLVLKSDENTAAMEAENAFNNGDYEKSITTIQKYLENNSIDTKARLALGISYLETGNSEAAKVIFDEIRKGTSTLQEYGIWYAALYHVKLEEYDQAVELLEGITRKDAMLYGKARDLMGDIEGVND